MKRITFVILAALMLMSLLTACGGGEAKPASEQDGFSSLEKPIGTPEPAPTPEPAEPTSAPEPPAETAAPTPDGALAVTEDGPFPGGLDDDGPGDLYENAQPVALTPDLQHRVNLFLSNFAEQFFYDFSVLDSDAAARAVDFAHLWCKINDRSRIVYDNADGMSFETLTFEQANSVVTRYLSMTLSAYTFPDDYPETGHSFYRDGKFWFLTSDGEAYDRIVVVDSLTLLDDGSYAADFCVYSLDLDVYYDEGIDSSWYDLTSSGAAASPSLTLAAYGTANISVGQDSFRLLSYYTWN